MLKILKKKVEYYLKIRYYYPPFQLQTDYYSVNPHSKVQLDSTETCRVPNSVTLTQQASCVYRVQLCPSAHSVNCPAFARNFSHRN
jgi:hypothetical protein